MTPTKYDKVGGAIGQVALKNSKFNKDVDGGGLQSARRLAKRLFSALSSVNPPRSHLVVAGTFTALKRDSIESDSTDFYPYFRTTTEAVSFKLMKTRVLCVLNKILSMTRLLCSIKTVTVTFQRGRCAKLSKEFTEREKRLSLVSRFVNLWYRMLNLYRACA